MKLNTRLVILLAAGGEVLAISEPPYFAPTPLPSNLTQPSAPTTSSSTPTVVFNLADPTVADMFQLGLNNGLRKLCLGNNSTISTLDSDNSTSLFDLPLEETQAGAVESTVTVTENGVTSQTAFAMKTTVTAVINLLTFADSANVTSAILEEPEVRRRANDIATRTATIQDVTRTATIEFLPFATQQEITSPTNAPSPASAAAPAIESNGSNTLDNQTAHQTDSKQQADAIDIFIAGFAVGEAMDNPCDPINPPDNSLVQASEVEFQERKRDSVYMRRSGSDGLGTGSLNTTVFGPDRKELLKRHTRRMVEDDGDKRGGGGGGSSGAHGGSSGGHGGSSGARGGTGGDSSAGNGGVKPGTGAPGAATSNSTRPAPSNSLWIFLLLTSATVSLALAPTTSTTGPPPNPTTSLPAAFIPATSDLSKPSLTNKKLNFKAGGSSCTSPLHSSSSSPSSPAPLTTPISANRHHYLSHYLSPPAPSSSPSPTPLPIPNQSQLPSPDQARDPPH
ncbi:MAG: hypothetical protein HETSPECPRED_004357 [Heterodermia speciosa]|uniref:Uncharacterized protein n=1 Tax=Heterodermia speciosa TaxID=116794 RepID=A0A8H3IH93_9LECA|nr:MAG: hypothetical protein HETSPECPRED_004357 [Heterodermia speciosa]